MRISDWSSDVCSSDLVVRRMFADVDADIYGMADGDATYDAASAPMLIARLRDEQLDMVVGSRVGEAAEAYRRGHRFGNRLLTGMLARLCGRSFGEIGGGSCRERVWEDG